MDRLVVTLIGVVIAGGPMVFFIWHEVSEALLGRPHTGRLLFSAVVLAVLLALLARVGRYLIQLDGRES
ncbi:MAG TPA: hypothetical protein VF158_02140 [Longimicrobiales bacterium]